MSYSFPQHLPVSFFCAYSFILLSIHHSLKYHHFPLGVVSQNGLFVPLSFFLFPCVLSHPSGLIDLLFSEPYFFHTESQNSPSTLAAFLFQLSLPSIRIKAQEKLISSTCFSPLSHSNSSSSSSPSLAPSASSHPLLVFPAQATVYGLSSECLSVCLSYCLIFVRLGRFFFFLSHFLVRLDFVGSSFTLSVLRCLRFAGVAVEFPYFARSFAPVRCSHLCLTRFRELQQQQSLSPSSPHFPFPRLPIHSVSAFQQPWRALSSIFALMRFDFTRFALGRGPAFFASSVDSHIGSVESSSSSSSSAAAAAAGGGGGGAACLCLDDIDVPLFQPSPVQVTVPLTTPGYCFPPLLSFTFHLFHHLASFSRFCTFPCYYPLAFPFTFFVFAAAISFSLSLFSVSFLLIVMYRFLFPCLLLQSCFFLASSFLGHVDGIILSVEYRMTNDGGDDSSPQPSSTSTFLASSSSSSLSSSSFNDFVERQAVVFLPSSDSEEIGILSSSSMESGARCDDCSCPRSSSLSSASTSPSSPVSLISSFLIVRSSFDLESCQFFVNVEQHHQYLS